jgi:general secretion pathway protein C
MALSASLAYWALQLFKAPPRPIAAVALQAAPGPNLEAAASLFGGQSVTVAVSNYQLRGVVAAANGRGSAAILAVDGKPAQALPVGKEIEPGVTVQEIHPRYVLLSEGGVSKRVELAADEPKSATGPLASPLPGAAAAQSQLAQTQQVQAQLAQQAAAQQAAAQQASQQSATQPQPPPAGAVAAPPNTPPPRPGSGLRMPTVPTAPNDSQLIR